MVRTAIVIALLFPLVSLGQSWKREMATGTSTLHHLKYAELSEMFKGPDSAQYVLTYHKPAKYWKKRGKEDIQCLVSRIDAQGNIGYAATLTVVPKHPIIRVYNKKFYLHDVDATPISIGGKDAYHYVCQVYNDKWQLETVINIPIVRQYVLADFAVTGEGNIVQVNSNTNDRMYSTYNGDRGTWLSFCSPTGAIEHMELFAGTSAGSTYRSYTPALRIAGDSVYLRLYKPFHLHGGQFDSVLHYGFDSKYHFGLAATEVLPPARPHTGTEIALTNGKRIITLDSGYVERGNDFPPRANKLALIGPDDIREWTMKLHPYWDLYNIKPLRDGRFTAFIIKKWEEACLVVCDQGGNQHSARSFPIDMGRHAKETYRLLDHYEVNPGELWLFYEIERQGEGQSICFEKIKL